MSIKNVVSVILRSDSELYLIQLRDNFPSIVFPGQWGLFGGTIEVGESPRETAFRELRLSRINENGETILLGLPKDPCITARVY